MPRACLAPPTLESDAICHTPQGMHLRVEPTKLSACDRCKLYLAYCRPVRALGEFGFEALARRRKPLMLGVAVMQLVCLAFALVCTIGMSPSHQVLQSVPWATYKYVNTSLGPSSDGYYHVYINLEAALVHTKVVDQNNAEDPIHLEFSETLAALDREEDTAEKQHGVDRWTMDVLREVSTCGNCSRASQVNRSSTSVLPHSLGNGRRLY